MSLHSHVSSRNDDAMGHTIWGGSVDDLPHDDNHLGKAGSSLLVICTVLCTVPCNRKCVRLKLSLQFNAFSDLATSSEGQ